MTGPSTFPLRGELGGNDTADWYGYEPEPGSRAARLTLVTADAAPLYLVARVDDQMFSAAARAENSSPARAELIVPVPKSGPLFVGVVAGPAIGPVALASYALDAGPAPVIDLAVGPIRVENVDDVDVPVRTDLSGGTGTRRLVHVTYANVGDGPAVGWSSVWARPVTGGALAHIGSAQLALEPGEARTLTFRWDARGMVGDVEVSARLFTPGDVEPSNDERSVTHYAVVGGLGVGAGAPTRACQVFACVDAAAGHADLFASVGASSLRASVRESSANATWCVQGPAAVGRICGYAER